MQKDKIGGQNVVWHPNPGPQTDFLKRKEFEVLYGGAAGGGKSAALIVEALRQVNHARYRAVIFRRTLPEAQSLIDASRSIYPAISPNVQWREQDKEWRFPSGAIIRFRYLEHAGDETRYQGHEFQYIAFDELTHFDERQYMYLFSRCRSADENLRCYVRAASNPGGPGHHFVKSRFIDVAPSRTTFTDPMTGLTRAFIPARVSDNPVLLQADPQYLSRLQSLPEAERRALLDGDWDAFSGQVFGEWRKDLHVETPFDIPTSWPRFRAMDWGFSKPYCILWAAVDFDGVVHIYRELYGTNGTPNVGSCETAQEVAKRVAFLEDGERVSYGVADPACWARTGHDGPTIAEAFAQNRVGWVPADNDRLQGKAEFHARLRGFGEGKPGVKIFSSCVHLIRTIPTLCYSPKKPEDVDTDAEDHAYDCARYLFMSRPWKPISAKAVPRRDAWETKESEEISWMSA